MIARPYLKGSWPLSESGTIDVELATKTARSSLVAVKRSKQRANRFVIHRQILGLQDVRSLSPREAANLSLCLLSSGIETGH